MKVQSNNKTIAKNTLFLYFRMMFTMIVSLYTSRVILQVLGVDDYGIYQAVGGIVGFLSFINGALSTGTSRFLTFELGTGDFVKLRRTFSTTLTIHIVLAILIVLLAETIGLWFLYNEMVIPPDRMDAAFFVYHISILTVVFTLTQVPYNASIIAHERMSIFAYVSIFEVTAKLLIVYMLKLGDFDKLKFYAVLLFVVQVGLMLFYRIYCTKQFAETKYKFIYDKSILKSIACFSGWSLFANGAIALNSQGILLLINMFFNPAVVAARAISIQVNMAINQFVNNFRTAVNPQIVKKYAAGDIKGSQKLLLESTKYSYYMMFFLCFPICLLARPILNLWLVVVPEYTVIFLQLILIQSLFQVFDTSFYTALYAKGQLRENALISPTVLFIVFPIVYIFFKLGASPVILSWVTLIGYAILGLVIKPILIVKIAGYHWKDILGVFKICAWVTVASLPIPIYLTRNGQFESLLYCIIVLFLTLFITIISIYVIGLDKNTKQKILIFIKNKIYSNIDTNDNTN